MLCSRCEAMLAGLSPKAKRRFSRPAPRASLGALLCARCRAVLPPKDPEDAMLTKLSQLSRFGLGADDRPLLAARRRGK